MPDFSGIYTKSESSHFMFLDVNREVSGELISSLQAFETSLLLISLGRWTNALISITNAVEILIREFTKGEREFYILINDFAASFDISDDLKRATHQVRKKRNEFTHSAVIPDDNDDAIRAYMQDALSVYKIFLQKSELLSNLVFEGCWSCGDLALFGGFNSVFECDAGDDFGEVVKAA